MSSTAAVLVTHNSEKVLAHCLAALDSQTVRPEVTCIVDSGSADTGYLDRATLGSKLEVIRQQENIGFARANNIGFLRVRERAEYILFLNPDTLIATDFIAHACQAMQHSAGAGILTGRLAGYDFEKHQPTGLLDSTGIFRKWYGRWYDRGQGEPDQAQYQIPENLPAACGALLFCRKQALEQVLLEGSSVFDPAFFLYKEDIELCLRIREKGWAIRYEPGANAFHGRGWQRNRRAVHFSLRQKAAASELLLYRRHPSPYLLWALAKYVAVNLFRL